MTIFGRMRNLRPGTTPSQYATMLYVIEEEIEKQTDVYEGIDPPEPLIADALGLKHDLQTRRIICREADGLDAPLNSDTTCSGAVMIWLLCAKFNAFIYGLEEAPTCNRRKRLDDLSINSAKSKGLVIFNGNVLEYTMFQVVQSLLRLRERWQYIDFTDKSFFEYMFLLELRAGFLANHACSIDVMDVPDYVKEHEGAYVAREKFWLDMEMIFFVMVGEDVFNMKFKKRELSEIHQHTTNISRCAKNVKQKWRRKVGAPFPIEIGMGLPSWTKFMNRMRELSQTIVGETFRTAIKQKVSDAYIALPVGEYEIDPSKSETPKLLNQLYSASGANYRAGHAGLMNTLRAFEDSKIRAEMPHGICQFESCPQYDIVILLLFDSLLTKYIAQWIDKFVIFRSKMPLMNHRPVLHNNPIIIQSLNRWDVLFNGTLWETKEVLMACFVWCYFIWYSLMGNVELASTQYSLHELLSSIFDNTKDVCYDGLMWPADDPRNIQLHE